MRNLIGAVALTVLVLMTGCFRDTPPDGTYECRAETVPDAQYGPRVVELVDTARFDVLVAMFAMKYDASEPEDPANRLLDALARARLRGVAVRVILDNVTPADYPATTNFLAATGVEYKIDPSGVTTHAKLVVIDGSVTVIGSHNWTESALSANNETSVVLHSEDLAKAEREYFYRLYDKY